MRGRRFSGLQRIQIHKLQTEKREKRAGLVASAAGVHPVSIPNPVVKPASAEGTALVTVWERTPLPTPSAFSCFLF
jgi:hypothetical protein